MRYLKIIQVCAVILLLLAVASCKKDYYQYDKYIGNGPLKYPGRPDSVQALAGKERILLRWAVPSDLNITGYKVFWNFGTDSLPIAGRKTGSGDSITVQIDNLQQGAYSFMVYSYDQAGHRSVGTAAIGNVYGTIFASTIFNRPYNGLKKTPVAAKLEVAWVGLDAKCIGTEWDYTDINGAAARFFSPLADSTIITSIDVAKPISYRSLFLPENRSIDTFYTEFKSL